MAPNSVQYQRGLSMPEFFDAYGSVEQCEALVRGWRWPKGFKRPRCRGSWHSEFRRQDRPYFQCSGCRYQCSLVGGRGESPARLQAHTSLEKTLASRAAQVYPAPACSQATPTAQYQRVRGPGPPISGAPPGGESRPPLPTGNGAEGLLFGEGLVVKKTYPRIRELAQRR